VKITGACTLSRQAFPYDDIWPHLEMIFEAFGIDRCMWGTDWTRAVNLLSYEQGVDAFRETDRLSDDERARLMGGTLANVYGWSPAGRANKIGLRGRHGRSACRGGAPACAARSGGPAGDPFPSSSSSPSRVRPGRARARVRRGAGAGAAPFPGATSTEPPPLATASGAPPLPRHGPRGLRRLPPGRPTRRRAGHGGAGGQ